MARLETPMKPIGPSAKTCFDNIKSTIDIESARGSPIVVADTHIRFFDGNTCYLRDQLDKDDDDDNGCKIFRPKCVAIGPRFHGEEALKGGEDIKRMAAWEFWEGSDQPFSALYGPVEAVAKQARGIYASSTATARFTDDQFTAMMFIDGCFLLELIAMSNGVDGGRMTKSNHFLPAVDKIGGSTLTADIFIVENQIPWVVLQALMSVRPIKVMLFIDMHIGKSFDARPEKHELGKSADDYRPIHLLDLFCKRQIGEGQASALTNEQWYTYSQLEVATLTSATELAEAGVDICLSSTPRFSDIGFRPRWTVFGRLSLPPLVLRQRSLALLLNMLAFELFYPDNDHNGCNVAAYLGMLWALMIREEDVRELRRKGIVLTTLGDKEMIKLLNKLVPHTYVGNAITTTFLIRANINDYFRRQRKWIAVHRFVYNNLKFLIAIGSFLSVSLSILKAILALPAGSSK